ncbi:MAG: crotonase/enoyl-CoA hydratase family protein [Pseudomonadota bacterium]
MIEFSKQEDVAIVKMDDGKVNAMSAAMLRALNESLDRAEQECQAIVLAGREGVFSAGFDIKTMQDGDLADRHEMTEIGSATLSRLFSSRTPIIAAVTGHGFALGAVIAAACDYSVGETGKFSFAVNETKIGEIFPPWGYEILLSKLSKKHVYAAAVLSQMYTVEQAVEANFLNEAVAAGEAIPRAIELAKDMAKLPKEAYWANKCSIRGSAMDRVADSVGPF